MAAGPLPEKVTAPRCTGRPSIHIERPVKGPFMYASVPGKHVFDLLHLKIAQVIGPIVSSLSNSTPAVYGLPLS